MRYIFIISLLLSFISCKDQFSPTVVVQEKVLTQDEQRLSENALSGLNVGDGMEAQLFAAEPLVKNPSSIDVDHRGRVWVVENVNYRPENNPHNEYQSGGDMITILEDTDGDGKADDRKIFYQDLLVDGAMGIAVLGNQVFLSSSPHILVLTDDNMDDKADRVDTLFTGMGMKQGDHTVHAVSFGPDGRLYFNYGNAGNKMLHKDGTPVRDKMGNIINNSGNPYRQGMVFRCELDGSNVETLAHNFRNNYEVCVDSYGRMWQSDNDDDGNKAVRINYVMEYGNYGYRDELTGAAWQVSRSGQAKDIPSRHWHQNDPGVIPNLHIYGSGSPCGITIYEGNLLPLRFRSQIIHADAGPGTVMGFPFEDDDAGFSAKEDPLLVRANDNWYRPTDVATAPDGSLFASDWYDSGVGGHWAADAKQGRIYRITTPSKKEYKNETLNTNTIENAITCLQSPNMAARYLGWQSLDAQLDSAIPALSNLWKSRNKIDRVRALWLMARSDSGILLDALQDPDELIRTVAVKVARQTNPDQLTELLSKAAMDASPKVRREVAIALHELDNDAKADIWATLAIQHTGSDRWYLEALGIAAMGDWDACLDSWLSREGIQWNTASGRDIIWRSRGTKTMGYLMQLLKNPNLTIEELGKYLRATDFQKINNKDALLASLLNIDRTEKAVFQQMLLTHLSPKYVQQSNQVKITISKLLPNLKGTRAYLNIIDKLKLRSEANGLIEMVLKNPNHELGVAAANILIERNGWTPIEKMISGSFKQKSAIIDVLGNVSNSKSKQLLQNIAANINEDMAVRTKSIESLSKGWGWESRMRSVIENESLDMKLRSLAASKLTIAARPIDRNFGTEFLDKNNIAHNAGEPLPPIQELLTMQGDHVQGAEVFKNYCGVCHKVNGEGLDFGPDLSDIANKLGKDALYMAVIYPDAAISHGYEGYHLELQDGTHYTGYILSQNSSSLTLKIQTGENKRIAVKDIKIKEALSNSLMTQGLAQAIGEEQLVDLVEYLATLTNAETMNANPFQGQIGYERESDQ